MDKLSILRAKIIDRGHLPRYVALWRFKNRKVVFTNGCFDILHLGHVEYLAKARDMGDLLVVGLNTDESVQRLKGPGRPVNPEMARASVLAALSFVDAVVLFNEDTPLELIRQVQPDILVKGEDYDVRDIVGRDIVEARGGQVSTIGLTGGYSTSGLIQKGGISGITPDGSR